MTTSNPTTVSPPNAPVRGFNPSQVSGQPSAATLGTSPTSSSVDSIKLQKELAISKEAAASYADRIKQLELELNKMYKEKYVYYLFCTSDLTLSLRFDHTQQKVEGIQIGSPKDAEALRRQLYAKDDIINVCAPAKPKLFCLLYCRDSNLNLTVYARRTKKQGTYKLKYWSRNNK